MQSNSKLILQDETGNIELLSEGEQCDRFIAYDKQGQKWYYSYNHNKNIFQVYINPKINYNPDKFNCEVAIFAGNLLRQILGQIYPSYVGLFKKEELGLSEKTIFFRVSKDIPGFAIWEEAVSLSEDGNLKVFDKEYIFVKDQWLDKATGKEAIPIKGFTSMLTAESFFDEPDWSVDNFGLVQINGDAYIIRIDPGAAFFYNERQFNKINFVSETVDAIEYKQQDLIQNYLNFYLKLADQHDTFDEYLAYKNQAMIYKLLYSEKEQIETLAKISALSDEIISAQAKADFSPEHHDLVNTIVLPNIKKRIKHYQQVEKRLIDFRHYKSGYGMPTLLITEQLYCVNAQNKLQSLLIELHSLVQEKTDIKNSNKLECIKNIAKLLELLFKDDANYFVSMHILKSSLPQEFYLVSPILTRIYNHPEIDFPGKQSLKPLLDVMETEYQQHLFMNNKWNE